MAGYSCRKDTVVTPLFSAVATGCWVVIYRIFRKAYLCSFAIVVVLAADLVYRCGLLLSIVSAVLLTVGLIVHGHLPDLKKGLNRERWVEKIAFIMPIMIIDRRGRRLFPYPV